MKRIAYRICFCITAVFIVAASLAPSPQDSFGASLGHLDKVGHFTAYGALFIFGLFSFQGIRTRIVVFVLAAGLGAAMEGLQFFVPSREISAWDELANIAGLIFGLLTYQMLRRLRA